MRKIDNIGRYAVSDDEGFEPGSDNEVLKNYLGVKFKNEMEQIEAQALKRTAFSVLEEFDEDHQFTAADICNIHASWLGEIYPSAGKYRMVNMSKEGFLFASAARIETVMRLFENNYLRKYTPCHFKKTDELAHAIAVVHVELIIIHPFREGNGRTARLLADIMAMQARRRPLDYSLIDQTSNKEGFKRYIQGIHAGHGGDYSLIQAVFVELLSRV